VNEPFNQLLFFFLGIEEIFWFFIPYWGNIQPSWIVEALLGGILLVIAGLPVADNTVEYIINSILPKFTNSG